MSAAITDLILTVFRLNGRLLAAGDALVADIGLTSARWQVLGAVALAPVPQPVAHIARNIGLARQSVQRIVDVLVAEGVLRLESNPHHARARLVQLTETGVALHAAASVRQGPWSSALAEGLDIDAICEATALLHTLETRLSRSIAEEEPC
jgi:DNA-binding MarR family transcriptional regulator